MELTAKQKELEYTQCPVCEMSELSAMDSVGDEEPFLWCPHCESTIDGEGAIERGNGTTEYVFDADVCSSSLDEWGWPMTEGETAHRWDDTKNPIECAECGAEKD